MRSFPLATTVRAADADGSERDGRRDVFVVLADALPELGRW
jgi:hypothetical protein